MFEHLDDPVAFAPSSSLFHSVQTEALRRGRRARLARVGVGGVAMLVLLVGMAAVRVDRKLDSVQRVEVSTVGGEVVSPGEPYTILMVGVDGSEPLGPQPSGASTHADALVLARVLPAENRVTIMSIPRDLVVPVPGSQPKRLALSLDNGGLDLLVSSIENTVGVHIDHLVMADFNGARNLGDAVGGLRFHFRYPVRDRRSGLQVPESGCTTLDGTGLLTFARSRNLEYEVEPGRWEQAGVGDLGRMARGQDVVSAAIGALSHMDLSDPVALNRLIDAVAENLTISAEMDRLSMVRMLRDMAGAELVPVGVIPVRRSTVDGVEVLELREGTSMELVLQVFLTGARPDPYPQVDFPAEFDPSVVGQLGQVIVTPC